MLAVLLTIPHVGTDRTHDGRRPHKDVEYPRYLVRGDAHVEVPAKATRERLSSQIEILEMGDKWGTLLKLGLSWG